MVAKTDYMSMAIVDYVMSAVNRWLQAGCTTSPRDRLIERFARLNRSFLYSIRSSMVASLVGRTRFIDVWYACTSGRVAVNLVREFACVAG